MLMLFLEQAHGRPIWFLRVIWRPRTPRWWLLQWRTQKIFMGGGSISGIWCSFAFAVRSLGRHNLTSYSSFQTNILAKFVDIICIFLYTYSPYFMCQMCQCTEYKLSALQVRISQENRLNATTQQFITAKISGCALKQASKIRSSLRQSILQLQNEAVLMSRRIEAVEHRKCGTGLSDANPGLQNRILLNYTRIGNAHKVHKKTFDFLLCAEVQQILVFLFPAESLSNAWMLLC